MKKSAALILSCFALGVIFLVLQKDFALGTQGDPDLYYHLAISKITAENGLVKSLHQVEDLGWNQNFPEKEFLFHVVAGLAQSAAGEEGVRALPLLFGLAILGSLIFLALQFIELRLALVCVAIPIFASPLFLFRLYLLRPHLLAILLFIVTLIGLVKSNKILVILTSALFALCYHAFYILLLPLITFAALPGANQRERLKLSVLGVLGLVIGIFVNPYYPSNILMGLRHLKIALGEFAGQLPYGKELLPLPFDWYLKYYFFHCGIAFFAVYRAAKEHSPTKLSIALLASTFLLLTIKSPRAIEYAVPLVCISLATALTLRRKTLGALGLFSLITLGIANAFYYQQRAKVPTDLMPASDAERILASLEAIPKEDGSKKIFNFEWQLGSYILYKRPDLRFVDLLDPSFLIEHDPDLYHLREDMLKGNLENSHQLIRENFHADYAVTINKNIAAKLKHLPNFHSLNDFENPKFGNAWIFKLD